MPTPIKPIVVIDTREQLPYSFPQEWPVINKKLDTGDYSILGHEKHFAIERKSLTDLLGCIFTDRFHAEMERFKSFSYAYLVIEASLWKILNPKFYKGNPKAVLGKLQAIQLHTGVSVLYLDSREFAENYVQGLISKYYQKVLKGVSEDVQ